MEKKKPTHSLGAIKAAFFTVGMTTHKCPSCDDPMVHEVRPFPAEYKAHSAPCDVEAWWCDSCGDGVLDGPALAAHERAYFELRAEVDSVLTPAQVAEVRQRTGLSQRAAGALLGGGPRAFQKYECGSQVVSVPMARLLQLLAKDPSRVQELPGYTRPSARGRRRATP